MPGISLWEMILQMPSAGKRPVWPKKKGSGSLLMEKFFPKQKSFRQIYVPSLPMRWTMPGISGRFRTCQSLDPYRNPESGKSSLSVFENPVTDSTVLPAEGKTSKNPKHHQGLGLSNIRQAAEKYQGGLRTEILSQKNGRIFRLEVLLQARTFHSQQNYGNSQQNNSKNMMLPLSLSQKNEGSMFMNENLDLTNTDEKKPEKDGKKRNRESSPAGIIYNLILVGVVLLFTFFRVWDFSFIFLTGTYPAGRSLFYGTYRDLWCLQYCRSSCRCRPLLPLGKKSWYLPGNFSVPKRKLRRWFSWDSSPYL